MWVFLCLNFYILCTYIPKKAWFERKSVIFFTIRIVMWVFFMKLLQNLHETLLVRFIWCWKSFLLRSRRTDDLATIWLVFTFCLYLIITNLTVLFLQGMQ